MKKLLLTLIVSFAMCGSIFAQYESYWPDFYSPAYEDQGALVAAIVIDGEIVTAENHPDNWDALEVAFFIDGVCRGNNNYLYNGYVEEYGDPFPIIDGNPVYYTDPGGVVTVMMYDHVNNILYSECTVTWDGEPFEIIGGDDNMQGWDDPENPIMLNFTSPTPPTPEAHYWADPDTWEGEVPEALADVTLTTDVIIGAGTTVNAGNVTLNGHTLTMEPGAEFYHTNDIDNMIIQMEVEGYDEGAKDDNPDNDGYRLIASPINSGIDVPGGLLEGEYDLYYFDQEGEGDATHEQLEWVNYKAGAFQLVPGKGYAYANPETVFVVFAGNVISTDAEVSIDDLANVEGVRFQGWNLVGNPFTCKADIIYDEMSTFYYGLNEAGDEVELGDVAEGIPPMGAVFIDAADPEWPITGTPYFVKYGGIGKKVKALSMTVTRDRGNVIDKAMLRFDNGSGLRKLQLNPNHTKVYMTMDGQDYAVLRAPEMGEMPVSFKAENNGTYTLNFASKEVSFNYLHLIDNMTGADVDLLQTPAYTFDAQTTDYASRFKLVFATGNNSEDSFAFFSNGSFVINNDGEATLQVIDVMGRILKSETINGSANVNVNAAPGVYMLRLINGSNMKVQKVIVK